MDSSPKERREGERPLGKTGGLRSWGMECEAGGIEGQSLHPTCWYIQACAREGGPRGTGHRASVSAESVKRWFQSSGRRGAGGEGGGKDIKVAVWA